MTAQAQAPAQGAAPGAWYDVPGVAGGNTLFTEQDETTTSSAINLAQGSQVVFQTILPFKQTDVVLDWWCNINVSQTYTAGTGSFTSSAYAPWNQIGPTSLSIQNQYASLDVESGIDLYLFTLIRPYSYANENDGGVNVYSNPAGAPIGGSAQGYLAPALAQSNLINGAQWTTGTTGYNLMFRIPAGQYFDLYHDLTIDGNLLSQPHPAIVSPQYMAGTTRVISPKITMNGMAATVTDQAPVILNGNATASGSATARLRRRAVYASQNLSTLPAVYPWQYRQKTTRFSIGAVSVRDIAFPLDSGQILAFYVRLFDPAANSGAGAPISLANLSKVQIQFGSGLLAFDANTQGGLSAGALLQRRWLQNHSTMLPAGVFAFDFALNERGLLTNARALNVLTTSGCQIHMEFTGAQSASSYAVLGVESLVYVS